MGVRLKSVLSLMALVAASTVSTAVTAQERPAAFKPRETIPDAVNRAFFGSSEGFQDLKRPIEALIGIPRFPENGIARDGDRLDRIYRDLLIQQAANDPLIRTVDLPNPYNTSILTLPSASVSNRLVGSELVFER
ncbi:MAG: hypothetical protein H7126_03375 [Candidatus Parcubacteria bacterium]|nr:hypothetical protein [Leptolyngbyaceae cyanobacterium LF-bin-113]